jgi:type I restriction-modification system DNA methylase subunit
MSMDLTGITNQNEYYTNHYFSSIFEENASETISQWRSKAKENESFRTPWAILRDAARQYYTVHDRFLRSKFDTQTLGNIRAMADIYLSALGYPEASPEWIDIDNITRVPVYLELKKSNGSPSLWILLAASEEKESSILDKFLFSASDIGEEGLSSVSPASMTSIPNEEMITKILFGQDEPPRFLILIGMNQIALIDRNKWNEKRYLQFELEEIFSRHEETTLQAMAVLLHRDSLCPVDGTALIDVLDSNSQKHAAGVSKDLKYALRESIELLGNEVLYDMAHRLGRNLDENPVDPGQLTLECLRYMYRMLFVLFIEARPELGYAPIKAQSYLTGYSLESLRDIADEIRDEVSEVGNGYYLHETLSKLYDLIYNGYPKTEEEILKYSNEESLHDMFVIAPLKAHIFDPEFTEMITHAKLRNSVMLRIIDLMSLTRETGRRNDRRGRISYANLGINQMGSVYEALLSYRGFIAEHTLFEVKKAGDTFDELDVGYFVSEAELDQYTEDERVRYEKDDPDGRYKKGQLRRYEKGHFIYRLAGREREKSASYYTPEVLTKCLVKYALKELLEGKTADEILHLTICEPAMGSAAFLNEAINQLAEAYLDRKQKELGEMIPAEKRLQELQKVKMYIADRNVYGIDLNPVAVELAEVSLWLNTIYEGGFVPWFGTQLVNGNSLIGARRQCYRIENLKATTKSLRWYENAPERVLMTERRMPKKQVYHFLLGDPGMCSYSDKVIKELEPENIKAMNAWNKKFNAPYDDDDIATLLRLSAVIDNLWDSQVKLRQEVEAKTQDKLSVYGYSDEIKDSHTTIRQKDKILSELYKSEHMRNAGPYARLKFAMDYWCALWFWPIDKADLLPTRSEFFFDMSLILEGTVASVNTTAMQPELFPTEMQSMAQEIVGTYGVDTVVDIPRLRKDYPRLNLAYEIAEQNHFMHWELEFADLFKERGGFDLVIGNPPWVKLIWNEQNAISDSNPLFAIKNLTATETTKIRSIALGNKETYLLYFFEYESMSGEQSFLNAFSNYPSLKGQQTNLYKCFLPQAWMYGSQGGVSAFVHPDGVFDDPKGGILRKELYPKLRYHFNFRNEMVLFQGILHLVTFSLNVYKNTLNKKPQFKTICNLFIPKTIDESFDSVGDGSVGGIKDENGWNTVGHKDRIISIGPKELLTFAMLFDQSREWEMARIPVLHAKELVEVLDVFAEQQFKINSIEGVTSTIMLDETQSQKNGTIKREVGFPDNIVGMVFSGPHFGQANPFYKTPKRECKLHSDYDCIDLSEIDKNYLPRSNYAINCSITDYYNQSSKTEWGIRYIDCYKLISRRMLSQTGERTLISAIIPPKSNCINTVTSIVFAQDIDLLQTAAVFSSLPYDALIKMLGRSDFYYETAQSLPKVEGVYGNELIIRALLLNALSSEYEDLFNGARKKLKSIHGWSKIDSRLNDNKLIQSPERWCFNAPLRMDYERRQALVEIDVLTAMALGISLEQLTVMYRILFPVLQSYESDTWYDANGRIVFTNNRSLVGVGFDRSKWENDIKGAPAGKKFYRTIMDDTMPGGPVERTIEYVAPFDRCDREQDYETAWKFFEEKYGKVK